MSTGWNPWHGCVRLSEGCVNCYVYRIDSVHNRDGSEVRRNSTFDAPVRHARGGEYKIPSGETVYTCLTSDFFLDAADDWRPEAWDIIQRRPDLSFVIITKRISRFSVGLPSDWGDGYDNVTVCCTCENMRRAAERMPVFMSLPIKHRQIICEPMLEYVDFSPWLGGGIERVTVGGESGENARICSYEWVLAVRNDAMCAGVPFVYHQTGERLIKDGHIYTVPRHLQSLQAHNAGIDT